MVSNRNIVLYFFIPNQMKKNQCLRDTKSFIDSIPLEESESKIFTEIPQQLVLDFLSLNQKLILLKR